MTRYCCSVGRCSGSCVVVTIVTFGALSRIACTRAASGSRRCSQLSSTSSIDRCAIAATSSSAGCLALQRQSERLRDRVGNAPRVGEPRELDRPGTVRPVADQ
jgi:predicted short-subunit dehydrogenase-like oxidoreductase (DUF2520 family)